MVINQIEMSELIQKLEPQQWTVFKEGSFLDSNVCSPCREKESYLARSRLIYEAAKYLFSAPPPSRISCLGLV